MDNVIILFGTGIALAIMGLVVAFIAVSYHKVLKEYSSMRRDSEKALDEARRASQNILKDATLKGSEILKNSEVFSREMKTDFQSGVKKLVDYEMSVYKDIEKQTNTETVKVLKTLSDNVGKSVEKYLSEVEVALKQQVQEATSHVHKEMEESLAAYKKERMASVDKDVTKLVREISVKVLGRGINIEDQEKLILKSLEEAKRDNVL